MTADGQAHELARPFLVIATQNPIEYEGTYPLPEAQLDRFMVQIALGYPTADAEAEMLAAHAAHDLVIDLEPVADVGTVLAAQAAGPPSMAPRRCGDTSWRSATRPGGHPSRAGASPRAALLLFRAAKAFAALEGRITRSRTTSRRSPPPSSNIGYCSPRVRPRRTARRRRRRARAGSGALGSDGPRPRNARPRGGVRAGRRRVRFAIDVRTRGGARPARGGARLWVGAASRRIRLEPQSGPGDPRGRGLPARAGDPKGRLAAARRGVCTRWPMARRASSGGPRRECGCGCARRGGDGGTRSRRPSSSPIPCACTPLSFGVSPPAPCSSCRESSP